jgi:hypothetical protein
MLNVFHPWETLQEVTLWRRRHVMICTSPLRCDVGTYCTLQTRTELWAKEECRWMLFTKTPQTVEVRLKDPCPLLWNCSHQRHVCGVRVQCSNAHVSVATEVAISPASVSHLRRKPAKWTICAKWSPHALNYEHGAVRMLRSPTNFSVGDHPKALSSYQRWQREGDAFPHTILTVDDSWMCSFDPELKRPSVSGVLPPHHWRESHDAVRVLFTRRRLVIYHPKPPRTAVSGAYCVIICDLHCVENSHKCWNVASYSSRTI